MRKFFTCIWLVCLCIALAACGGQPEPAESGEDVNYTETPVEVESDFMAWQPLPGMLTLPNGVEKPPVAILVHGSGPNDMDETIGGNAPFADIARGLAERGVAVLRYDKRTYAYPGDLEDDPTISGEVLTDAASAIGQMQADERVGDVWVIGHSLGGMMAPKIAQDNPDIAGIVLLAGSPRNLADIIYDQYTEAIGNQPLLPQQREEAVAELAKNVETVKHYREGDEGEALFNGPPSYWASLNAIDTPAIAQSLTLPVLVLQGGADYQVYPDVDYVLWQEYLGDRDNVSFKLYNDLNHLFMPTQGKRDGTEYTAPSAVSAEVLDDIAGFIKAN